MRGKTMPEFVTVDDGVQAAMAFDGAPVVIAEPADNAGGGAPSDNTTILRELIEREATNAAIGPIWDPIAVRLCFDAGDGAPLPAALRRQDRSGVRPAGRRPGRGDRRSRATAGRASGRPRCRWATARRSASAASRWC